MASVFISLCVFLFLQEGGVDVSEYQKLFEKNQELQREVLRLSEENMELRFETEAARKDVPRMKVCCILSLLLSAISSAHQLPKFLCLTAL